MSNARCSPARLGIMGEPLAGTLVSAEGVPALFFGGVGVEAELVLNQERLAEAEREGESNARVDGGHDGRERVEVPCDAVEQGPHEGLFDGEERCLVVEINAAQLITEHVTKLALDAAIIVGRRGAEMPKQREKVAVLHTSPHGVVGYRERHPPW